RGDEYYAVAKAEAEYDKLIKSTNDAPPKKYHFDQDALEVRDRVIDYLFKLEQVDGFSSALISAIGKLKGYFARVCLVLEVARRHDPIRPSKLLPPGWTRAEGERLCKVLGVDANESLGAGIDSSTPISRETAEAAEKVLRQFLLPHIFGL